MYSLANARSAEELRAWVARMRIHLAREGIEDPAFEFVAEPKIDGLAISLIYRDGVLRAGRHPRQRRGSARTSPTTCARSRRSRCASRRTTRRRLIEVRGEVYMSLKDFARAERAAGRGGRSPPS